MSRIRKSTLLAFSLAFLIALSSCSEAPPPPSSSSQPDVPAISSAGSSSSIPMDEQPPIPEPPAIPAKSVELPEATPSDSSVDPEQTVDTADFETVLNEDGTVTIKRYLGPGGDVIIPSEIDGKLVTAIGNTFDMTGAFQDCTTLTSVVIPDGVTEIQDNAFYSCTALETVTIPASVSLLRNCAFCDCPNLRAVYFEGDAPQQANYVFDSTENVTMYYLDGTAGWSSPWHGRPAEMYAP